MQPFIPPPKRIPNWQAGPPVDPAVAASQLAQVQASRPLRPPPFVFAARRLTAGQLEARRELRAAGGHPAMPRERDDGEQQGERIDQIVSI